MQIINYKSKQQEKKITKNHYDNYYYKVQIQIFSVFNIISAVIPIISSTINKITHVITRMFNDVNIAINLSKVFLYVSISSKPRSKEQ